MMESDEEEDIEYCSTKNKDFNTVGSR